METIKAKSVSDLLKKTSKISTVSKKSIEMLNKKQLVHLLFSLRVMEGYTQSEFAIKSKFSQSKISKIEHSEDDKLTLGELDKYCNSLNKVVELRIVEKDIKITDKIKHGFYMFKEGL